MKNRLIVTTLCGCMLSLGAISTAAAASASRIIRQDIESSSPVTVLDAATFEQMGVVNIEDALSSLPGVANIQIYTNKVRSAFTVRGIDTSNAFAHVYVNGVAVGPNIPVFDANTLPYNVINTIAVLPGQQGEEVIDSVSATVLISDGAVALAELDSAYAEVQPVDVAVGQIDTTWGDLSGIDYSSVSRYLGSSSKLTMQYNNVPTNAAVSGNFAATVEAAYQSLELSTDLNRVEVLAPGFSSSYGTDAVAGVVNVLQYQADNGLQNSFENWHWGEGIGDGDISATFENRTSTSLGLGVHFEPDTFADRLDAGGACTIGFQYEDGIQYGNLIAYGETKGDPYIFYSMDFNLTDDRFNLNNQIRYSALYDTDNDGYYNLDGRDSEWTFGTCFEYKHAFNVEGGVVPPQGEAYLIEDAKVEDAVYFDLPLHFDFGGKLPLMVHYDIEDGEIEAQSDAETWFPFGGTIDSGGSFSGSGTTSFAGINNVSWSLTGTFLDLGIQFRYDVGLEQELPGGESAGVEWYHYYDPAVGAPWQTVVPEQSELDLGLRINGWRGDLDFAVTDSFSLSLSIANSEPNQEVDYWLVAEEVNSGLIASFDLGSGIWLPGLWATATGPLSDLPNTQVFISPDGLPEGDYNFYGGVDYNPNQQLDVDSLDYELRTVGIRFNLGF